MKKRMKKIMSMLLAGCLVAGNITATYTLNAYQATHLQQSSYNTEYRDDPQQFRENGEVADAFYSENVHMQKIDANANAYTGKVYTHATQFDSLGIVNGIDVSEYQKEINWTQVKAAGIEYAIIRVGFRGYGTAGNLAEDKYFHKNMQGAIAAGLKVGVYIFSQAITPEEAVQEAQYILDRIGTYQITMPLVLDYEYAGTGVGRLYNAKLSKDIATSICLAFSNKIKEAGYHPMVYANSSMLTNQLNASTLSASCPIWLANYTTKSNYTGTYNFWQYSSEGTVPGISGNVDMDFWYTNNKDEYSQNDMVIAPIPDTVYTGQPIVPEITVTSGNTVLVNGTDYTCTLTNNVEVGTATVTITGCGAYEGIVKTLQFNIVSPSIDNVTVSATTKTSATISWTGNSCVSGYEIYRATTIDGNYKKVKTISENTTTSYKQTGLTSGKEYYYQIVPFMQTTAGISYGTKSDIVTARVKNALTRKFYTKKKYTLKTSTMSDADNVVTVPKYSLLTIQSHTLDKNGATWYRVTYKANGSTYNGYIPKSKGSLYRYGKVKSKILNVRKGASTSKRLVVTLKKGKKFTIMSSKKDQNGDTWYKISVTKGKYTYIGYVNGQYVKIQ